VAPAVPASPPLVGLEIPELLIAARCCPNQLDPSRRALLVARRAQLESWLHGSPRRAPSALDEQ
jgi:hypothetical protein